MTTDEAPHGAVLIYKHVNRQGLEDKKPGHAEIKFNTEENGKKISKFYYGPLKARPIDHRNDSRYVLIGIMIKSPLTESQK
jgi:hypothetical protein